MVNAIKNLIFLIVCTVIFSTSALAWEKVLIPNDVPKKKSSPWNFFEDFEDQNEGKIKFCLFSKKKTCLGDLETNNKGKGNIPFRIASDDDGNKFLRVTVKHGWNTDSYKKKGQETERAEIQTKQKRSLNKFVWIGFKVRLPTDFEHINARVLFFQFKNQHDPMKKSPLLGLRWYKNGNVLDIGGDTGGDANKSYNPIEYKRHGIGIKYTQSFLGKWLINKEKDRDSDAQNHNFKLTKHTTFEVTKPGKWSTYKIGIHNSKNEDGFVKVFKDDKLIFDYSGTTYDWSGNYTGSHVRIGLYRDSGLRYNIEYPDQTIHFDDLAVVSDKETLDSLLD